MIIISLSGGLGNQMFQYAFGKALSLKHGLRLSLETSFFDQKFDSSTTPRSYALGCYELGSEVQVTKSKPVLLNGKLRRISQLLHRIAPSKFFGFVVEKGFEFRPEYLEQSGANLYSGYWQSYKYIQEARPYLLKDFKLRGDIGEQNRKYHESILSSESIALHIRRGDYITNQSAASFHGVCSLSYYNKALNYLGSKLENPKLFVFSDDPTWVKENLKSKFTTTFITGNESNPEFDIYLISQCRHFVIANSSFSWWGAFLGETSRSYVIRPQKWFAVDNEKTIDLCPKHWKAF
ncbi:MAG: hypothetical protein CME64_03825 [Halobacteriovoraceae bacterium]|nr:hypothetical protein [Halobacteriovoraceae bacterium]